MSGMRRHSADDARRAGQRAAQRLAQDERVRLVYLFGSAGDPSANVGDRLEEPYRGPKS